MSKKISQLESVGYNDVEKTDLLTFVDNSEEPEKSNKSITMEEFVNFVRNNTNFFPIPYDEKYILPEAIINNQPVPISSKVSNKTVNLSEIGAFKFDKFGRVYDYDPNIVVQDSANDELFIAAGTAASLYKDELPIDVDGPFPNSLPSEYTQTTSNPYAGFFNSNSYYYPKSNTQIYYPQRPFYSNTTTQFNDWSYLFNKDYSIFSRSKIVINYGAVNNGNQNINSFVNLEINWVTGQITGTGLFGISYQSNAAINVIFNDKPSLISSSSVVSASMPNDGLSFMAQPKLIINLRDRKLIGLPIGTPITSAKYQNIGIPLSIMINSYI